MSRCILVRDLREPNCSKVVAQLDTSRGVRLTFALPNTSLFANRIVASVNSATGSALAAAPGRHTDAPVEDVSADGLLDGAGGVGEQPEIRRPVDHGTVDRRAAPVSEDHLRSRQQGVGTGSFQSPRGSWSRISATSAIRSTAARVEQIERRVTPDQQCRAMDGHCRRSFAYESSVHSNGGCERHGSVDQRRANPLALGPLQTRDDVARAVIDLYEPLLPHISANGARVRLGSFASVFEQSTAELEGFARPLYGIVPLVVGGYEFAWWERFQSGLDAGTDQHSTEYWGPVPGDNDQRMVEQAAIGLRAGLLPRADLASHWRRPRHAIASSPGCMGSSSTIRIRTTGSSSGCSSLSAWNASASRSTL